jgi:hypothetical protein
MLLHVVHETRYRYAPAVVNAHHVVHLKPASRNGQSLLRYDLRIDPAPCSCATPWTSTATRAAIFRCRPRMKA